MSERSEMCSSALREVEESIVSLCAEVDGASTRLLDVGCWDGVATMRYANAMNCTAVAGLEYYRSALAEANGRGVEASQIDLEAEKFPYPDDSFDVVICNQVYEHLKNVFLVTDEIARVLRPGGRLLFSVPNLASMHNRLLLLAGQQPTSIRVIGPHVRSFAPPAMVDFFESQELFRLYVRRGNGFPPLKGRLAQGMARLAPLASHSLVFGFERTDALPKVDYAALGLEVGVQTVF